MPAKDIYHDNARKALVNDGWSITQDPLRLSWGGTDMYVDLGAERVMAAEKANRKIAVEVKSFVALSLTSEVQNALGQYLVYRSVLAKTEPDRTLYLAVHSETFLDVFAQPLGRLLLEDYQVRLMVFDLHAETISKWIR